MPHLVGEDPEGAGLIFESAGVDDDGVGGFVVFAVFTDSAGCSVGEGEFYAGDAL